MELFKHRNTLKPSKGSILISEPFLPDPNFMRAIILLCEHNAEGSFGFVLNKSSMFHVGELFEELQGFDLPVYIGGPVQQDKLYCVHKQSFLEGTVKISENMYWGGDFEMLMFLIKTKQVNTSELKFFLGYSGWSDGQLEEEVEANSWIVSNKISHKLVFDTHSEIMWKETLQNMGKEYSFYSHFPVDPRLN